MRRAVTCPTSTSRPALRCVHDEVVDAQPQHDVTRVVDEVAGLGGVDRSRRGVAQLRGAAVRQLDTRLAPGERREAGAVEADADLAGVAVVRHADLGQCREQGDLVGLICPEPRLVHRGSVDTERGCDGIGGIFEPNCEGWCAHRGQCGCCAGGDGVDGCRNGNCWQLRSTRGAGAHCHEAAAENGASENECCESIDGMSAKSPVV